MVKSVSVVFSEYRHRNKLKFYHNIKLYIIRHPSKFHCCICSTKDVKKVNNLVKNGVEFINICNLQTLISMYKIMNV